MNKIEETFKTGNRVILEIFEGAEEPRTYIGKVRYVQEPYKGELTSTQENEDQWSVCVDINDKYSITSKFDYRGLWQHGGKSLRQMQSYGLDHRITNLD